MNPFAIFVGSIYIVYYNYTLNGWQNIHWMKQWASTQKKTVDMKLMLRYVCSIQIQNRKKIKQKIIEKSNDIAQNRKW